MIQSQLKPRSSLSQCKAINLSIIAWFDSLTINVTINTWFTVLLFSPVNKNKIQNEIYAGTGLCGDITARAKSDIMNFAIHFCYRIICKRREPSRVFCSRMINPDRKTLPRHASKTTNRISATALTAITVDDRGNSDGNFVETE